MTPKRSVPVLAATALATVAAMGLLARAQPAAKTAHAHHEHAEVAKITRAVAVLAPTEGKKAHGTVTFTQEKDGVHVVGKFEGLAPGEHGFHVHEFGDITSPDGKSAGGHFNPDKSPHAGPDSTKRHAGDLGNVKADGRGIASYDRVDPLISLHGEHGILGRSLVLHEKTDDFKTQDPPGNAGGRVAYGVIGVAKGE